MIELRTIKITICQACLDGVGEECHTPGCALWLHRVDLPIAPELYEIVPDENAESAVRLRQLLDAAHDVGLSHDIAEYCARKALDDETARPSPEGAQS